MLKNILSCLMIHRQTGASNNTFSCSARLTSNEYGSNNPTYKKFLNLQKAMNRRYCITFCITIFYLQLTYSGFINGVYSTLSTLLLSYLQFSREARSKYRDLSQNNFEFLKHALIVKVFTHLLVGPHNFYKGTTTEWERGNNAATHSNRQEWKEFRCKEF